MTSRKAPSYKWVAPKKARSVEKVKLGPGSYEESKQYLQLKRRSLNATLPKVARGDIFVTKEKKLSPGVGQYSLNASLNIWKGPNVRRR